MIKIILLSVLFITTQGFTNCYTNLGNVRSTSDPIMSGIDVITLDTCKGLCDNWDTDCSTYEGVVDDCENKVCQAGVVTDEGCILYDKSREWYQNDEVSRDQAFRICDEECWEDFNTYENLYPADEIMIYDGSYTEGDCESLCVLWSRGVAVKQDGSDFCYGVTTSETECRLVKLINVTTDIVISADPNTHYREYICDIDTLESSIKVFDPNAPEEEEEEAEASDSTVVIDSNGDVSCTQAEIFSECDFTGYSAIVNMEVLKLDWEPQSWCVPDMQTLWLHNAYDLEGQAYSQSESVYCISDIEYLEDPPTTSFLSENRKLRRRSKRSHVSVF